MQTMNHAIAMPRPRGLTPQRTAAFIFAGLLQVALIAALIEGLNIKVWPEPERRTKVEIVEDQTKVIPEPPPPANWRAPVETDVAPPIFQVEGGQENQGITLTKGSGPVASFDQAATSIAETHTIPPYPPLEARLGAQGIVRLRLTISPQGRVSEAMIVQSSGTGALDQAAREWIVAHWRYRPAIRDGAAVASAAEVQVKFDLKNVN